VIANQSRAGKISILLLTAFCFVALACLCLVAVRIAALRGETKQAGAILVMSLLPSFAFFVLGAVACLGAWILRGLWRLAKPTDLRKQTRPNT